NSPTPFSHSSGQTYRKGDSFQIAWPEAAPARPPPALASGASGAVATGVVLAGCGGSEGTSHAPFATPTRDSHDHRDKSPAATAWRTPPLGETRVGVTRKVPEPIATPPANAGR